MSPEQATILIVDDNPELLELLQARLEIQNYHAITAESGEQALQIIDAQTVHLILLDLMMPDMDGFDVLKNIKAHPDHHRTPVVMMSALNDLESVVKCITLGAEDYLFKPINNALFWARINASLARKQLHDREQAELKMAITWEEIDRELNTTLELTTVAEIALKWALHQTDAGGGIIGTSTNSGFELWHTSGTSAPLSSGLSLATLISTNEFVISKRPQQWALGKSQPFFAGAGYRIFIPINRDEKTVALMLLDSKERLAESSLSFLSRLSNHAAIALSNANLHAKVQAADQAKSNFVALVSHELKSPLSVFSLYAELMRRQETNLLIEKKDYYLKMLESTIERMISLVSELDDISRVETGNMQLECTAISLNEIIHEVIETFNQTIEDKQQHVKLDLVPGFPHIWADHQRCAQILTNLISNASKYTPASGEITVCIKRKPTDPLSFALISVSDTGIGIKKADQPKIFTQFFRADEVQAENISGSGLGLHITRRLVEMQRGEIWFESKHGSGTSFHFTMPFATAVADKPSSSNS